MFVDKCSDWCDDCTGNDIHRYIQGGPKKRHKVNDTIILQPYIVESGGFQQNVSKEILYMTEVSI